MVVSRKNFIFLELFLKFIVESKSIKYFFFFILGLVNAFVVGLVFFYNEFVLVKIFIGKGRKVLRGEVIFIFY